MILPDQEYPKQTFVRESEDESLVDEEFTSVIQESTIIDEEDLTRNCDADEERDTEAATQKQITPTIKQIEKELLKQRDDMDELMK